MAYIYIHIHILPHSRKFQAAGALVLAQFHPHAQFKESCRSGWIFFSHLTQRSILGTPGEDGWGAQTLGSHGLAPLLALISLNTLEQTAHPPDLCFLICEMGVVSRHLQRAGSLPGLPQGQV